MAARATVRVRRKAAAQVPDATLRGMEKKLRLGGMALQNGVLVHGPTAWGAAVRLPDGTIKSASGAKPRLGARMTLRSLEATSTSAARRCDRAAPVMRPRWASSRQLLPSSAS